MALSDSGVRFNVTATNATSAVATRTGVAGTVAYITDIMGSSDKAAALILVKDGTTVIWQGRVSNTAPFYEQFDSPLKITAGADCSVTVDGTAICTANLAGWVMNL